MYLHKGTAAFIGIRNSFPSRVEGKGRSRFFPSSLPWNPSFVRGRASNFESRPSINGGAINSVCSSTSAITKWRGQEKGGKGEKERSGEEEEEEEVRPFRVDEG